MAIENDTRILMLDNETTNSLDDPLCYDVGYEVFDLAGNLYDRNSFVNGDVFCCKELMASAYFLDKMPQYWEEIKAGKRQLASWYQITKELYRTVIANDVKIICAHNARFDYMALHKTQRYTTCSKWRWVFPWGVEWWDTLKMARDILKDDSTYKDFCAEHEYLTTYGKPQYTAEVLYKFIMGNIDFTESHTGLEDVQIERKIFEYLMARRPECDGRLWKREEEADA